LRNSRSADRFGHESEPLGCLVALLRVDLHPDRPASAKTGGYKGRVASSSIRSIEYSGNSAIMRRVRASVSSSVDHSTIIRAMFDLSVFVPLGDDLPDGLGEVAVVLSVGEGARRPLLLF
jgi:hypothetical protein